VHDLLAHVDRCTVALERLLDRDHGSIDARAVTARSGEENTLVSDDRVILKPPGRRTHSWDTRGREMYDSRGHSRILLPTT
jgi:hypothetical protein